MPLKIWLPANSHLPFIGSWLELPETAYIFSWTGAIYDLSIVFFLLYKRTRLTAYAAVIVFHLSTAILFQSGMFPYIMILATLIFFPPDFHQKLISGVSNWLHFTKMGGKETGLQSGNLLPYKKSLSWMLVVVLVLHFTVQLLLPLRNKLYSGDLLWTEQGYRFSWRVMLMEKAGHAVFQITDPISKRSWEASNYRYLTPNQEKMMATQPDMILQFAHYLEQQYQKQGYGELEITANCYVTLNGNRSQPFIDPQTDLTQLQDGWAEKSWIRPMNHSGNQISSMR
jgi:hypothetical protein